MMPWGEFFVVLAQFSIIMVAFFGFVLLVSFAVTRFIE